MVVKIKIVFFGVTVSKQLFTVKTFECSVSCDSIVDTLPLASKLILETFSDYHKKYYHSVDFEIVEI